MHGCIKHVRHLYFSNMKALKIQDFLIQEITDKPTVINSIPGPFIVNDNGLTASNMIRYFQ